MSHTKGPWETSLGSIRTVNLVNGVHQLIANVAYRPDIEEMDANAKLMTAAPEMLEVLEELQWEYVGPDPYSASHRCPSCRRRREDQHTDDCWIGNVIKKAKGEK